MSTQSSKFVVSYSSTSYTLTSTDSPTPSALIAHEHISLIVGVIVGVGLVVFIVSITIFLCKKCVWRRRQAQAQGASDGPPNDDTPGEDPHYDEAMQQRMDEWAAIRRRRPAKPYDKRGNNLDDADTAFAPGAGTIFFIIQ